MSNRKARFITRFHVFGAVQVAVLAVVLMGMIAAAAAFAQAPEQPSARDVIIGKEAFRYCVSCHGEDAKGDGPIAGNLAVAPSDLTRLTDEDGQFPFEEVMKAIDGRKVVRGHSKSDMPDWGNILAKAGTGADEEQVQAKIKSLTNFLWSIQVEDDR